MFVRSPTLCEHGSPLVSLLSGSDRRRAQLRARAGGTDRPPCLASPGAAARGVAGVGACHRNRRPAESPEDGPAICLVPFRTELFTEKVATYLSSLSASIHRFLGGPGGPGVAEP